MNNDYLDSNYKLVYVKKLNKQNCFYEDNGEASEPLLRHGILTDKLYKNRKYISTINGKSEFNPLIEIYTRIFTDTTGTMIINVFDIDRHQVIKQIVINMDNNDFSISDFNILLESYKSICESDSKTNLIDLLKKIKFESNDLKFEEYC